MKVEYLALVISGLINPLFLVILTLAANGLSTGYSEDHLASDDSFLLGCVLLPSPLPREGHFLWVLGMGLGAVFRLSAGWITQ